MLDLWDQLSLRQLTPAESQRKGSQAAAEGAEGEEEKKEDETKENAAEIEEEKVGVTEEEVKEGVEEEAPKEKPYRGRRLPLEVPLQYNFRYLCEEAKRGVPEPVWPDPDKEPLPPPVTH